MTDFIFIAEIAAIGFLFWKLCVFSIEHISEGITTRWEARAKQAEAESANKGMGL